MPTAGLTPKQLRRLVRSIVQGFDTSDYMWDIQVPDEQPQSEQHVVVTFSKPTAAAPVVKHAVKVHFWVQASSVDNKVLLDYTIEDKKLRHRVGRDGVAFQPIWLDWEISNKAVAAMETGANTLSPQQYRNKLQELATSRVADSA